MYVFVYIHIYIYVSMYMYLCVQICAARVYSIDGKTGPGIRVKNMLCALHRQLLPWLWVNTAYYAVGLAELHKVCSPFLEDHAASKLARRTSHQ